MGDARYTAAWLRIVIFNYSYCLHHYIVHSYCLHNYIVYSYCLAPLHGRLAQATGVQSAIIVIIINIVFIIIIIIMMIICIIYPIEHIITLLYAEVKHILLFIQLCY